MELFSADEFQTFIRCINCMSKEDFAEMYHDVFDIPSESYINEKFNLCRSNFVRWICIIDANTLNKMMTFCLNK